MGGGGRGGKIAVFLRYVLFEWPHIDIHSNYVYLKNIMYITLEEIGIILFVSAIRIVCISDKLHGRVH